MEMSKKFKMTAGILAAITLVGVGCWIYQLINGLTITGMNNATSWGLYIMMFMFFVGLSAGGLIVASSASVFHIEKFKKVALPAVICSTVCICCAGMFVLIDLGGIHRIWNMLLSPNLKSPLLWDVCVITCYLIINVIYLYFMTSKKADKSKVAVVSRFALPVAILVHSVTAWIFALQIARESWYSAIMAPIFVASAMDSGLALLLIVLAALNALAIFKVGKELFSMLAGLLATFVAVDAFFIGCELLTMAYPGTAHASATLAEMTSGATAPFFWFEMIFGLLVPFVILVFAKNRQNQKLVIGASVLVVLGVLCKRAWLLFTAFLHPNVDGAAGITIGNGRLIEGMDIWTLGGMYAPTPFELVIVAAVISLGALGFMVLSKLLIKQENAQ